MIDRFGDTIRVGWSSAEILWLEAATSLAVGPRISAFRDIAEMSGRSFEAVRRKASKLRCAHVWPQEAPPRRVIGWAPASSPAFSLKPASLSQRMGGR